MKKYDDEFKREAVGKILDGQAVASVSRELGVSENRLHAWKKRSFESSTDAEKENIYCMPMNTGRNQRTTDSG